MGHSICKLHLQKPEQRKGKPPSVQSDIYAIGQMLHIALTGVPVQLASNKNRKILVIKETDIKTNEEKRRSHLKTVVNFCVARDPKNRYGKVDDLKRDLLRIKQNIPPVCPAGEKNGIAGGSTLRSSLLPAQLLLLIIIFLAGSWGSISFGTESPPSVETIWNKASHEYSFGDKFSLKVVPKDRCYCYIFYAYQYKNTLALYPTKDQGFNTISPENPLDIYNLGTYILEVDDEPGGKLIVLSIRDGAKGQEINNSFLRNQDWLENIEPKGHWLKISGEDLLNRLKNLKKEYPNDVYYSVEDAPIATQKPAAETSSESRMRSVPKEAIEKLQQLRQSTDPETTNADKPAAEQPTKPAEQPTKPAIK